MDAYRELKGQTAHGKHPYLVKQIHYQNPFCQETFDLNKKQVL